MTQSYNQKTLHPKKNPKNKLTTTQKRHQNFDFTTIADRLRTVSLSNDSHQTDVVKSVNRMDPNLPTHHNSFFLHSPQQLFNRGHEHAIIICSYQN